MAEALFSFEPFEFNGIQGGYGTLEGYEKDNSRKGKQDHLFGIEDWEEFESLCSQYGLFQESIPDKRAHFSKAQQQQQQSPRSNHWALDELQFDTVSTPIQPIQESKKLEDFQAGIKEPLHEPNREKPYPFSLSSLELLNNYGGGVKKLKRENLSNISNEINAERQRLSTEEVMRVAGARYVEFSSQRGDDFTLHMHAFGFALMGLSQEETKDVELVHFLLSAAEKVGCQQFERASRFLTRCEWIASDTGNPVERIVFYFAKALREKIDRETGHFKGFKGNGRKDLIDLGFATNLASIACHQDLPFIQVTQFTGIQAIVEHVALSGKIHLVDLAIRSGVQWTVLMQALADRDESPVSLLKITAVTTMDKNHVEETGKRLESFAKSLNLPFSFNVVFVTEMKELKEELLAVEAEEVVAVYAPLVLRSMIPRPDYLDVLMRVIKKLSPSIMVVTEVEANHNSPSFVTRFIEALFFYSAFFHCLEVCMGSTTKSQYRMMTEAMFFGEGIRNMIAAEGEERFLEKDGKCLIVGWKGTPIHSLSAWKFT
ncbi:DELLA protein GAI1 [Vitis vinifera]|uniref:DELLA protein GAI1 n=1 Tax=Vitis vinifera TaxID=29760 RepID=A0A438E1M0_VITVI|nr:DELLA protein GAI1 [Vitis vinifera]